MVADAAYTWRDWQYTNFNGKIGPHSHSSPNELSGCPTAAATCGAGHSKLPFCADGLAEGSWKQAPGGCKRLPQSTVGLHHTAPCCPDEWCAPSCRRFDFSARTARACLGSRWVHFAGDSHSRNLFDGLSAFLGCNTNIPHTNSSHQARVAFSDVDFRYDSMRECTEDSAGSSSSSASGSAAPRVTYLFRAKMMHQHSPRTGRLEEDEQHDAFFVNASRSGKWPDVLVYSVGSHEALRWGGSPRPAANRSIESVEADTAEFLRFLYDELRFPGLLLWWKPVALPQAYVGQLGREVIGWHAAAATAMTAALAARQAAHLRHNARVAAEAGGGGGSGSTRARRLLPPILLADLWQTSIGQPSYVVGHYHQLVHAHNNILLGALCPGAHGGRGGEAWAARPAVGVVA